MSEEKQALKVDMGAGGVKTVKMDFPSNSLKAKAETVKETVKEEPKKVEKVITGTVVQRKKSLGRRFMETFIGEDVKNIKSYIFNDVLIPAAKDTITDIAQGITDTIQGSIEVALFGEARRKSSRGRRDSRSSYVSYNSYSSRDKERERERGRDKREERSTLSRKVGNRTFDDIILETRGEAEAVRDHLVDLIIDYGQASISDLYDLVGVTGDFTDVKYGWDDLSSSSISRARGGGYIINLPKPILLD